MHSQTKGMNQSSPGLERMQFRDQAKTKKLLFLQERGDSVHTLCFQLSFADSDQLPKENTLEIQDNKRTGTF